MEWGGGGGGTRGGNRAKGEEEEEVSLLSCQSPLVFPPFSMRMI